MKDVITQFMWAYQQHFRSGLALTTRRSLESIGLAVDVRAILVGFAHGDDATHPICVEPEDGVLRSFHLTNVLARAAQLSGTDSEGRVIYGDAESGRRRHIQLIRKHRAQALVEAIEESGAFGGFRVFASSGATAGAYDIHSCVCIDAVALDACPSLDDEVVDRFHVGRSLQHEVIAECLRRADAGMYAPDAGADLCPLGVTAEAIARAAAIRLARGAVLRVAGMPSDLFEAVTAFSSLGYERADAEGRLIITAKDLAAKHSRVRFALPVSLHKPRLIRKLLEVTDGGSALLADYECVYGIGALPHNSPSVEVSVKGRATWDLAVEGKRLMKVAFGHPVLPAPFLSMEHFIDVATRIVGVLDGEKVWGVVRAVQEGGHGTTLVVCRYPLEEARRLGGQAVVVDPANVAPADIVRLSLIDGAVILGPDGQCYAFGVILDGMSTGGGDPARGSRFNSAIRYHASASKTSLLVVISEDGTVDLIPQLRPRVARHEVESAVTDFCSRCAEDPVDGEEFARAHDRVLSLQFYLNEDQCKRVSEAYANEMQRRLKEGGVSLSSPPLHPHPDMNDSFFR